LAQAVITVEVYTYSTVMWRRPSADCATAPRRLLSARLLAAAAAVVCECLASSEGGAAPQRAVYSIGDLHGDHDRFRTILQKLGLARFEGDKVSWTGGDAILVSTGDSVDRGEHGRAIYLGFRALAEQAAGEGGEVVNIIGNHELMNLQQDLRYVNPLEYGAVGGYGSKAQRNREWSATGSIGKDIRTRFVAATVREGSLFVHGGLKANTIESFVGDGSDSPLDAMNAAISKLLDKDKVTMRHKLFGDSGPFWNRFFAEEGEAEVCKEVKKTLAIVKAKRMVMGHSPQMEGVAARCKSPEGPLIILGDTVISRAYEPAFGFSRMSAVEYRGDAVTALYFPDDQEAPRRKPVFVSPDSSEL